MSIHKGHRQRMKERFCQSGLETMSDHEVLELLLYYCIPRSDTNEIAHRLIDRFGSLLQVVEASPRELEKIPGIGGCSAQFLSLLSQFHRRLNVSLPRENRCLADIDSCGDYLYNYFSGVQKEVVYLLCLDAKTMVIDCFKVGEGGVTSAGISIRNIIDIAINSNAVSVVLAHNHPGGFAIPSHEDLLVTKRLAKALFLADVTLLDHIIVADRDYVSLRLSGLYDPNCINIDE